MIDATRICWKCGKPIKVACFALKNYVDINSEYNDDLYLITSIISKMPESVLQHLQNHYNFKEKYSQTIKDKYWANCCLHCDSLQGNNFLFYEPFDSPFYVNTATKAKQLTVYRIKLQFDICVDIGATFPDVISFPANEPDMIGKMIDKYAIHTNLNF